MELTSTEPSESTPHSNNLSDEVDSTEQEYEDVTAVSSEGIYLEIGCKELPFVYTQSPAYGMVQNKLSEK